MNIEEKANAMMQAAKEAAGEYIAEGKPDMASKILKAFLGVPDESLARLHDILVKN